MNHLQLITSNDYHETLLREIPKAKKRIVLAAMLLLSGPKVDALLEAITKAIKRGVPVHIMIDSYNRIVVPHSDLPKKGRNARIKKTYQVFDELGKLGARISEFGTVRLNPYRGRCHVKLTVIDDHAFCFGGVNMRDDDFERADYMLHTNNAALADCLEQLIERVSQQAPPLPNAEVDFGDAYRILFDGGQPKQSLIYDRACELASQAKRAYFVSHFMPSGRLASLLTHIDTTFYSSRPEQLPAPNSWGQAFDQNRYHIRNEYKGKASLHAKFILFEMPGNRKVLLSGSHNFTYRGVAFGTQEIALQSTNETLWRQLYDFLDSRIRRAKP